MNKALETALKAKGWSIGDAADLLSMTDEQRQLLDQASETPPSRKGNQPAPTAPPNAAETHPAPPG